MTKRPIPGYEGYFATSDGRILSFKNGLMRELKTSGRRYLQVRLANGEKGVLLNVHRAVLRAFKGEPPFSNAVCRHLDGNPHNNVVKNLAWGTIQENWQDRKDHGRPTMTGAENVKAKLTEGEVREIRKAIARGHPQNSLAVIFKVDAATINHIVRGRTWKHV